MCVKLNFLTTYLRLEDKSVALNQTLFQVRVLGIINTVCLILYHRRKLFFSHHNSVKQFEVEFFKLVVFVNIFKMIEKGVQVKVYSLQITCPFEACLNLNIVFVYQKPMVISAFQFVQVYDSIWRELECIFGKKGAFINLYFFCFIKKVLRNWETICI